MPRKSTVYIYDGDDMERLSELMLAVQVAERQALLARMETEAGASNKRFGDDEPSDSATEAEARVQAAKDAYDAYEAEACERAEAWVVQAIGHEEFRDLIRAHPPRKVPPAEGETEATVDPDDEPWGLDVSKFGKALLLFRDPDDPDHRTILEPDLEPDALEKRIKRLAAGEFDEIWARAYGLNGSGVGNPKAVRFSTETTPAET